VEDDHRITHRAGRANAGEHDAALEDAIRPLRARRTVDRAEQSDADQDADTDADTDTHPKGKGATTHAIRV
jgi:hypothetical protein